MINKSEKSAFISYGSICSFSRVISNENIFPQVNNSQQIISFNDKPNMPCGSKKKVQKGNILKLSLLLCDAH